MNGDEPVDILLVDDKPSNLVALASFLQTVDYRVVSATSGAEGLERLQTGDFAVILTDVMMPGMDGFEFVRRIKESDGLRDIPIIFLTAMASEVADVFRGYAVGAVDYLQKPLEPDMVKAKVAVFAQLFRQRRLITRQAVRLLEGERREQAHLLAKLQRDQERQARAAAEAAERRLSFLDDAGRTLASSLDFHATLRALAALAVPTIADWCYVDILEEERVIQRVAIAHGDPRRVSMARELERRFPTDPGAAGGLAEVLRSSKAQLSPEINDAMLQASATNAEHLALLRALGGCSSMIVPLVARGRTFGGITFVSAESGRRFNRGDLALAEDLASRAALAVDNARLYHESQVLNHIKDEFLATLHHELRTPLNAIVGWLSILEVGPVEPESLSEGLQVMRRSAAAQTALIDDMLDVSRIITGKLTLSPAFINLTSLIRDAIQPFELSARVKKIELRAEVSAQPLRIYGDPARVQQILWNLLSNAVKFTSAGGRIEVVLRQADGMAEVTVRDDGKGIDPGFLPHIFERFRQEDSSITRSYGGLGLGLAIVRHLAELHGGTVQAESAGKDQGASFKVAFPLAQATQAAC